MKNRVSFIVPYFGKLPAHFQIYLDSCSYNKNFSWIIFSDDRTPYSFPENVQFIYMTFRECIRLIQSKFSFEIVLDKPQKLCDYKCAYGYIFSDYIKGYEWWGHRDIDQIFGNLNRFITDEMLLEYDKIGSLGHMTLYRNTYDNNTVFMSNDRYKEVFATEHSCAFDEWLPGNINEIYDNSERNINLENLGADVNPYMTTFQTVYFDLSKHAYIKNCIKNSIFYFNDGMLTQLYKKNGIIAEKEFPYVHLQKRNMRDVRKEKQSGVYYIIPNRFIDSTENPKRVIDKLNIFRIFNYQFFKVKYNSLKYRIKNSDWKFTNVFK